MGLYMSGISDIDKRLAKSKQERESALYEIANYYMKLNKDEKEAIKILIKEKSEEVRRDRLLRKKKEIDKELGINNDQSEKIQVEYRSDGIPRIPSSKIAKDKKYELLDKLYKHVCKEFQRVVDELLGEDYYNMGMDQYTCTTMMADDLISKYKKKKGRR